MPHKQDSYTHAASEAVELGNRLANADMDADIREIGDGLLSGAVQYWLFANQPCRDPGCVDCASISTAEARLAELLRLVEEAARASEYFHSPNDANAGRA